MPARAALVWKEDTMIRQFMSVVAVGLLLAGQSHLGASQSKSEPAAKPMAPVNLNTATERELEQLPGVGAATAARIVEYRQKKGPFKKIEELMNVQGIGERSFLKLKPQITVGTKPDSTTPQ
jgi:competence protein ComEA